LLLATTGKQQTCQGEWKESPGKTMDSHDASYDATFKPFAPPELHLPPLEQLAPGL
jgi:hypothetical protein